MVPRKRLEALVWKHTHRDFRGKLEDGTKTVLVGTPAGTCLIALTNMTDAELLAKLPARVRAEIDAA
jgi:hypothetical protein